MVSQVLRSHRLGIGNQRQLCCLLALQLQQFRRLIQQPRIDLRQLGVDQLDLLQQVLAQFATDDLVANLVENRRRIRTGLTVHPCTPRADVAGTVHQPPTEPEFLARAQAHHVIGACRVGQFRQRLGALPVLRQAVLQLGTLAVFGTAGGEAPFQGDPEHLRRGPQVG
ncbi:hypothetical protein D9M70_512510 [compost metagenome]